MRSEVQGHENPVFLGGSPQIKTRTVSQIMARQSSETGRHLLSEPGTPLSPPAHGDVFFPVEGRRPRRFSLTGGVPVPSDIKIKPDSDRRYNSQAAHTLFFLVQIHCSDIVPEAGENASYPDVARHRPQQLRLALCVAMHFLLCNSLTFPAQNVGHLPVKRPFQNVQTPKYGERLMVS